MYNYSIKWQWKTYKQYLVQSVTSVSSICSKCNKEVEVSQLADGCVVQITKCVECTNTPVIKDVCVEN